MQLRTRDEQRVCAACSTVNNLHTLQRRQLAGQAQVVAIPVTQLYAQQHAREQTSTNRGEMNGGGYLSVAPGTPSVHVTTIRHRNGVQLASDELRDLDAAQR